MTLYVVTDDGIVFDRFLDSRVFATCSDDSTVALWDARNLRSRIRTLQGHSNWVKNIEFSQSDGLLVTSGFDGSIYTWDINRFINHFPSLQFVLQHIFAGFSQHLLENRKYRLSFRFHYLVSKVIQNYNAASFGFAELFSECLIIFQV